MTKETETLHRRFVDPEWLGRIAGRLRSGAQSA